MSLYRSEPGVERVRIHSYPKRRRQPRYPGLRTPIVKTANDAVSTPSPDNPCYGDFFLNQDAAVAS